MKTTLTAVLAGVFIVYLPPVVRSADLRINEFMAVNETILQDEDGDYSDWIEILNAGTSTVDLAGYHLTDDNSHPDLWTFPPTSIPPGGFVVVFASDKDRTNSASELHTNFKLSGDGEYLGLIEPDGSTVAFEYAANYPAQVADVSYGVEPVTVSTNLITTNAACTVLVPTNDALELAWVDRIGFDDSGWTAGTNGVGYESGTGYEDFIKTDVGQAMHNSNGTVYIRLPFVIPQPSLYDRVQLRVKYDDGFVAYINGQPVAEANAPDEPTWNSLSTNFHSDSSAIVFEDFEIPDAAEVLEIGTNMLAVHAMNESASSSDLLFVMELNGSQQTGSTNLFRYFFLPTPGADNLGGTNDLGPVITLVGHSPKIPEDADNLIVTARVVDVTETVSQVTLHYRTMFGAESSTNMADDGLHGDGAAADGVFGAVIPASAATPGQMIRYCITAADVSGDTTRQPLFPDPLASPEYLGTVVNDSSITSQVPVLHWFVQSESASDTYTGTRGSLFYLGRFYDNIFCRERGGSSTALPKPSHKFDFNAGSHFLFDTNLPLVEEVNLNTTYSDKTYLRRPLSWETLRNAGVPYSHASLVRVHRNGTFYSLDVWVEQVDETYLRRNDLDPNGALYKMFNELVSSTKVEKKTRKDEDHSDLQALIDGINSSSRFDYLFDNVNIASVVNFIAGHTLINDRDYGKKNHYLYRDTEGDQEWEFLPWDKDLTFGKNWGGSLRLLHDNITPYNPVFDVDWNMLIDAIYDNPLTRQMYTRRLRTLMDDLLQPPDTPYVDRLLEQRIDEILSEAGADMQDDHERWGDPWSYGDDWTYSEANGVTKSNYLDPRRMFLYVTNHISGGGEIPDQQTNSPVVLFGRVEFTPANGNQDQEYVELVNTNAFAVDITGWRITNAVDYTFPPGTVIGSSTSMFVSPNSVAFRSRPTSPTGNERRFVQDSYSGSLSSRGETLWLVDNDNQPVSSLAYTGSPSLFQKDLRVTEIMYHPGDADGSEFVDDDFEFLELKNTGTNNLDLTGVKLTDGVFFTFTNVFLGSGQLLVLVRNPAAFTNRYDTNGITLAGVYSGTLRNTGEEIRLEDPLNETILKFDFDDGWYALTDGEGYSLNIRDDRAPYDTWPASNSWRAGAVKHGTPGFDESSIPAGSIVINEILTHTDATQDWVEIHNTTTNDYNIGGWLLSDQPTALAKYTIPSGTVITGGQYLVIGENEFNNPGNSNALAPFAFSELGEAVHFSSGSGGIPTEYRESETFGAAEKEVTFGRYLVSDGSVDFVAAETPTPGAANSPPKLGEVVITEIMYNPAAGGDEFVEIFNTRTNSWPLYDVAHPSNTWKLTGGIGFTFPSNQVLTSRRHTLVVATNDPYGFRLKYDIPQQVAIFGPYTGSLNNAGESIKLRKPGDPETNGLVPYIIVDRVKYGHLPPWSTNADGGGPALEKRSPDLYGNEPTNWTTHITPFGSPGTLPQYDADGDCIPDNWEVLQFGDSDEDAGDDFDMDGADNLNEYYAGTVASNGLDKWSMQISESNGNIIVSFPTIQAKGAGYYGLTRYYDVERLSRLATQNWDRVNGYTNIVASGAYIALTNEGAFHQFYRIRTRLVQE
ncbi:MAG: lamin tail domain-containing protein [Verrucomicrobia bacterium]|nr:lamin tail domain-containing protein [Verrucomicrobiota bacterium]